MIRRTTVPRAPFFCLIVFLVAGCASVMTPGVGRVARPDAAIPLVDGGIKDGAFVTGDLRLDYELRSRDGLFSFRGELRFDDSLTYTFPTAMRFILRVNFLDTRGAVLATADISPLISRFNTLPESLPVGASGTLPKRSRGIAFNYYGEFVSNPFVADRDEWEVFYFPFE